MAGDGASLEETPAFAAAVVCFVLVIVSIIIEHIILLIGQWLKNRNKIKLYEAVEKIKSELMLVGFISLLLTTVQSSLAKITINRGVAESWLPCKKHEKNEEGEVHFISQRALHELHVFIFVLACAHVINCVLTMVLGKAKMKHWRKWEGETKTEEYQSTHNSKTPRYSRETTFVRRHFNCWTNNPVLLPITCFFQQFFPSVRKVDYLTLRHGFITAHVAPENQANFDFHKYMDRSLEEDFKVVVGIGPPIWFTAVISLLFNKYQFRHSLWLPAIPLIVLLVVGTKLQLIIAKMALRIQEASTVVLGVPVVQLQDDHFWFNRPRFLLHLINFILFQNAFQVAFYQYIRWKFGPKSCFFENKEDAIIIMCMGLVILILCGYVTLPLYALVTLMGSTMKGTVSSRMGEDKHQASSSSSVRPYPEHQDAADQAPTSIHGQSLYDDGKESHKIEMVELAIQNVRTEFVESKDSPLAKRPNSRAHWEKLRAQYQQERAM